MAIENEASKLCEASPWAADKRAAEIVRPAPVQTADSVTPKSVARDMALALQSSILSAAEAVQAAKLHSEMLSEQQAIMLGAGGPGTGTCWTPCTSHRQNCHRMRIGGWPRRYGLVLRRTLVRDLRVL